MATRAINTVFTVGGENEYRASIKRINAVIKELNSELELSKARFEGQEGSYTALFTKQQQMIRMYEAQNDLAKTYAARLKQVQDSTNSLNERSEELVDILNQLDAAMFSTSETSTGYDELVKEAALASAELKEVQAQMGKNATAAIELETGINKAHTEMEKLSRELDDIDPLLREAEESTDAYAHSMDGVGDSADGMKRDTVSAIDAIETTIAAAQIDEAFRKILDAMVACSKEAIAFESAMAGVFKTVDATAAEEFAITEGIRQLSTEIPATTEEIAAVAEVAGQLGIATEEILEFTETMIKMGTSTELSAEEAAMSLAKMAEIMGVTGEDFERMGSSIVDLGNNFNAMEEEIVEIATRMAGSGDMIGMTADQLFGIATAIASVGIEADAGGSAMQKLFGRIQLSMSGIGEANRQMEILGITLEDIKKAAANDGFDALGESVGVATEELETMAQALLETNDYAEVAGMGAAEFARLWEEDAAAGLNAFIEGLARVEASGGDALVVLDEMGLTEIRLSRAIMTLASSEGILSEALDLSARAWEENTALTEEAERRYETTESKIQIAKNQLSLLKQEMGEDFMTAAMPVIEGLGDIAENAAEAAEESPALAAGLAGIGGAMGGLAGLATVAAGIQLVSKALAIFGTAAGPVAVAVTALAGLGSAVAVYQANAWKISEEAEALAEKNKALVREAEKTAEEWDELQLGSAAQQAQVEGLIDKIDTLSSTMSRTPADTAVLAASVEQLNELLPGLGLTFDEQTGKINKTKDALLEFAEASAEVAKTQAARNHVEELTKQQGELQFQYDLTKGRLEEAKEAHNAAKAALFAYTEEQIRAKGYSNTLSAEYRALNDESMRLYNETKELESSLEEIEGAILANGEALEEAAGIYNQYAGTMEETAQAAIDTSEQMAIATERMIAAGSREYETAVAAAEEAAEQKLEAYKEGLDAELEALEDKHASELKYTQRANKDLLRAFKDSQEERQKELEASLTAEMDALEKQHNEKLALIDEEYKERMKLYEGDERWQQMVDIDAEIESIEKITEEEEKALEQQKQNERIAALEKAVSEAEDREKKAEAEKKLADYLAELERERLLEERDAQIEALEERKKLLEEELKAEKETIDEEHKAALEAAETLFEEEKTLLEEQHKEKRDLLSDQLADELTAYQDHLSDQLDALRDRQSKEIEEKKKTHETYLANRELEIQAELEQEKQEAKDRLTVIEQNAEDMEGKWHDYFRDVLKEAGLAAEDLKGKGKEAGEAYAAGLQEGLNSAKKTVGDSSRSIAEGIDRAAREVLQIQSPSRKAMETFAFYGEGAVIALKNSVRDIEAAAREMLHPLVDTESIEQSLEAGGRILQTAVPSQNPVDAYAPAAQGGVVNQYTIETVTIDAKNVKEFNDIVQMVERETVDSRMGSVR